MKKKRDGKEEQGQGKTETVFNRPGVALRNAVSGADRPQCTQAGIRADKRELKYSPEGRLPMRALHSGYVALQART